MKNLAGIILAFVALSNIGHAQTNYSKALTCNSGTFGIGFYQQSPESESLPNIIGISFESTFGKRHHRFFNTSFGLRANLGSRNFDRVVQDIEFEGGYQGFASYSVNRYGIWGEYLIGAQIGKIVEVTVPLKVGFRTSAYRQEFDLYEGQEIAQEDLVSEDEAAEENNDLFFRSNKVGVGSGINLAFLPNKIASPFIEIGYSYFGREELPLIQDANMSSGELHVPTVDLSNNTELNFRIGVRFNIGCPTNTNNVYRNPSSTSRNAAYREHPEVKTRVVLKERNSQSTQSKPNESERVILNPNKPRTPRAPK